MRTAAVVPAGGAGARMGGRAKQYLPLRGEPVLLHSLRPLLSHPSVEWVIVAVPSGDAAAPPAWLRDLDPRLRLVAGGAERSDSVANAIAAVPRVAELVVIHDGARPLLTPELLDRVLRAASDGSSAIAAVPVTDTIKKVDDEGRITATLDRRRLWRAQTPQVFPLSVLLQAHEHARASGESGTDDAALVERAGAEVIVVDGSPENIKVTVSSDLLLAEAILGARHDSVVPD